MEIAGDEPRPESKGPRLAREKDVTPVRATREALNEEGFEAQLTEIKGHTHDYYGRSGEINKAAWAFLRDKQLDFDPQYQQYVIVR